MFQITEKWYVDKVDDLAWGIYERKIRGEKSKNPGEVYFEGYSYHMGLARTCWRLTQLIADEGVESCETLEQYIDEFRRIAQDVETKLGGPPIADLPTKPYKNR